jgi:hypothetical protein
MLSKLGRNSKIMLTATVVLGAAILALIMTSSKDTTAAETNIDPVDEALQKIDEERDKKEAESYAKVQADPKVKKYTDNARIVKRDFRPAEWRNDVSDEVKMEVFTKKTVVGDWHTALTWTYSGRYDIKTLLTNGEVTSVDITPLPDKTSTITFTETEKVVIAAILQDSEVQRYVHGRDHVYPMSVWYGTYLVYPGYDCSPGSCAVVRFGRGDTNEVLSVWINPESSEVQKLSVTGGWQ